MKKVVFAFTILVSTILGCKKEDIAGPVIKFTSPEDNSVIVPGNSIDITYSISDETGIKDHRLDVIDADTTVLYSFDKDKSGGTYKESISLKGCTYKSPVIIRVTAVDATGNISSNTRSLDGQALDVNLSLFYDGEPLIYLKEYAYPTGQKLQFTRVSMYVSDVGMSETSSPCVHFLDFTEPSSGSDFQASQGLSFQVGGIPDGTYSDLNFLVGVNEALNDMTPGDFSSTHPLSSAAEYWNGWKSYVFLKLEGKIDLDDNPDDLETAFGLHLGGNKDDGNNPIAAQMAVKLDSTIVIENTNRTIKFGLDVKNIFVRDGNVYGIKDKPQTHAPESLPYILTLARNTEKAFFIR